MPKPSTPSGTRKLSEVARHLVVPTGIVSTGWPSVRAKCLDLGVRFDRWQDGLGSAALAKRADGRYAAGVDGVVVSIPRQVGKTYTVGAILFALCILCPGLTVIWTAHRLKTAGETFRSMQGMARRQRIAPFVDQVFTGSGDEEVRFRNGSRILFGARERGFGRGFAEVDVEVFDEAQILTERALDDMVPAANASRQPAGALLFFIGTPPKPTDPGEAFTAKRAKALSGKSTDMLFIEMSADPDADLDDRRQWSVGNASYPHRTPADAMLRMRSNLSDDSFRREALGVWDDDDDSDIVAAILGKWPDLLDVDAGMSEPAFVLDVSPARTWACIAAAGPCGSSRVMVEVTGRDGEQDYRHGVAWVLPRLQELAKSFEGFRVSIAAGSGAESLKPDIEAAGVPVDVISRSDVRAACGLIYDIALSDRLRHLGQPSIGGALASTTRRDFEDGFYWTRRKSSGDITPWYAATLAVWAARTRITDPVVNFWTWDELREGEGT